MIINILCKKPVQADLNFILHMKYIYLHVQIICVSDLLERFEDRTGIFFDPLVKGPVSQGMEAISYDDSTNLVFLMRRKLIKSTVTFWKNVFCHILRLS